MNISSLMNSLSSQPSAFLPPPLRQATAMPFQRLRPHSLPLPPLSVAIATISTSPLCVQTKKRKGSPRVARSILKSNNRTSSSSNSKSKSDKDRKSRIVFDFTEEEMAKYYHLPQRVAAKRLGVAVITIKRNCKRRGIKWPYRAEKLKEIQEAKAKKPRSCSSELQQPARDAKHAMTPMMMLSEAARAYSRLPIDCMANYPAKTMSTTGTRC